MPLEEFLKAMDISPCRLAKDISASRRRIGEILRAKGVVTADTALCLGRKFGIVA
jgi:addiction module HigA family antidote